jgi:hypothetical protein
MSKTIVCNGPCNRWTSKDKHIYEIDKSVQLLTEIYYKKKNIKYLCEECIEYLNDTTSLKWQLKPVVILEKEED